MKKLKLAELTGKEAKQAIKDYRTIPFEEFAEKYDCDMVLKAGRIIDDLKLLPDEKEEKKTLSDEIHEAHEFQGHLPATLLPDKVRKANKEFIEKVKKYGEGMADTLAKEIYGERLI